MFFYGSYFFASLRAVASIGVQRFYSDHPAFLTDGAEGDIDPADSEQLFLPSLLSGVLFSLTVSEDLTT